MTTNAARFLEHFALSYFQEGSCIEYFINRPLSEEVISSALIFSYNATAKDLHVSRFYPELHHLADSKYMSAACFYLLIHHCATCYGMDDSCHISLETVPEVCNCFYAKLKDFNFHIHKRGLGNVVELTSDLCRSTVDTHMIQARMHQDGAVPFMK
jgi:hypothetical protein